MSILKRYLREVGPGFIPNKALPNLGLATPSVAHFKYDFAVNGGLVSTITPVSSAVIPANAIVYGALILTSTAVTSTGSATISFGTSAGSSAASVLAATAKTAFAQHAIIEALGTNSQAATNIAPFRMTADGRPTLTIAVAALTAGVIEGFYTFVPAFAS